MSRTPPENRVARRFGEKLKALRIQKGMTLQELATSLGHSAHGYISELEAGKKQPTVVLVIGVADLFGVSTDELLRDEFELRASGEDIG